MIIFLLFLSIVAMVALKSSFSSHFRVDLYCLSCHLHQCQVHFVVVCFLNIVNNLDNFKLYPGLCE